MHKTKKTLKNGKRGGTSYWTVYRKSREATHNSLNIDPHQPSDNSFEVVSVHPEVSAPSENFLEFEEPCDGYFEDFMKPTLLSPEDDFDDINNTSESPEDNDKFDRKATSVFRQLVLRHPQMSNLLIDDMLRSLQSINIKVPKDHRTLLQTANKALTMREVPPGLYWHFGLLKLIDKFIENGIELPKFLTVL